MTMNYTGDTPEISNSDSEASLFAASPAWERGSKRRNAARRVTPMASTGPLADPVMTSTDADAEPLIRTRTVAPRKGVSPALIGGAVAAVLAVGAVGLTMTGQRNEGVPELTPGVATESEVAAAPLTPAPVTPSRTTPSNMAATPAPAAAPQRMAQATERRATTTTSTRTARVRPAASAASVGAVDASARLPEGPQPYGAVTGDATSNVTAPAVATPAPSESTAAPIPATPPVAADTAPVTPEPAPTAATPPQS